MHRALFYVLACVAAITLSISPAMAGMAGSDAFSAPSCAWKEVKLYYSISLDRLVVYERTQQIGDLFYTTWACNCYPPDCKPEEQQWLFIFWPGPFTQAYGCQWDEENPNHTWPPDTDDPTWNDLQWVLCRNIGCSELN